MDFPGKMQDFSTKAADSHRRPPQGSLGRNILAVDELVELRKRQATGQLGHQSPRKNIYKARYFMETDLDCDDPLYDGEPVF